MRADAARADRHRVVRAAADGWRRAGAIDEATLRAIVSAHPDDRVRLGLGLRVLAGLAAFVGGAALAGLLALVFASADWFLALGLAVLFTAATEIQTGGLRRAQAGAEYATAALAASAAAVAWLALTYDRSDGTLCAGIAAAFAFAAWRWGYALFAVVAGIFVLLACGPDASGRLLWLAMGVVAFPMILRGARSPGWAPAHRRCFAAAGLVLLVGAYLATNIYTIDHRWIAWSGIGVNTPPWDWARGPAIAGTILLPPIVLAVGLRFRDRSLLAAGALFTAASCATLRHYHPVGPNWLVLILGGAVCLSMAVALRRCLDAGQGRERWGFTAEPCFEDRRMVEAARAAATLVAMSPGPRVASEEARFEGGGGRSGGGGAAGEA